MFWVTGILYFLARVIIGKFEIKRNVQVLMSFSCRVPFTYGTLNPVILLPSGATSWPEERLRSVLIHELAHVIRFDSLTQQFGRSVHAFFWFIPVVWIAYRHLRFEQEKSCDEYAVNEGIEAARYVRHILNLVRFARGSVLLTGIYFSRGKRSYTADG